MFKKSVDGLTDWLTKGRISKLRIEVVLHERA